MCSLWFKKTLHFGTTTSTCCAFLPLPWSYIRMHMLWGGANEPRILGTSPGGVAVYIFMLLSGYLIALSWSRDPCFSRFLVRRIMRIFPALIVFVLLAAFVLGPMVSRLPVSDYFSDYATWRYLKNIVLASDYDLPGVFEGNPSSTVNGSIWTLRYEFLMYLVLAALVARRPNHGRVLLGACLVACIATHLVELGFPSLDFPGSYFIFTFVRLGRFFFIGALWAHAEWPTVLNLQHSVVALLLMLVLGGENGLLADVALLFLLPIVIMPFATTHSAVFARFFNGVDISYGLYIYAFPVQQVLVMAFGVNLPCLAMALLAELLTLPIALVSWLLVEKHAMAFGRALVQRIGA